MSAPANPIEAKREIVHLASRDYPGGPLTYPGALRLFWVKPAHFPWLLIQTVPAGGVNS